MANRSEGSPRSSRSSLWSRVAAVVSLQGRFEHIEQQFEEMQKEKQTADNQFGYMKKEVKKNGFMRKSGNMFL